MPARDPASVLWDRAAARLLERAYAARGQWVATRIADPSPRTVAMLAAQGVDAWGPDNKSGSGTLNARTAWARGFVRAVYYANDARHGGRGRPIEVEVGRHKPPVGIIPAGRAVRIRRRVGGKTMLRAVERKPLQWRTGPEGGQANPSRRDWAS